MDGGTAACMVGSVDCTLETFAVEERSPATYISVGR